MQCLYPVSLFVKDKKHGTQNSIQVPCGRCVVCRINRTREWSVRLLHELSYHEQASFVTLTYDDVHVPLDFSLSKRELQLFFKRLRKSLKFRKISYYACGEYGDTNGRPHYHAIIFGCGLSLADKSIVDKCWSRGFTYFGNVEYDSCRYVAQYIDKKYNGELASQVYGTRQPPFQLQSKGLGLRWAMDNQEYLSQNLGCTIHGKQVGLPRYYLKKLPDADGIKFKRRALRLIGGQETWQTLRDIAKDKQQSAAEIVESSRRLTEATIMAKQQLFKRDITNK